MTSDFTVRPHGFFGELEPGSRIAGYVIEEQIGAGGMAVVFRARDEMLGRLAAVKVIAPPMAGDPEFRARFLRESRSVAAINSQHIIPVYGAGEAEGTLYIATRFAAGGDLAALARRAGGFLAPDRAATLVAQVASALDAAHAAGLVHRDVKPQNILIDSTLELPEHAFLSDFGLTKGTGSSTGLTAAGQFVGTPEYCAPEQIRAGSVDGRADQYALGCVAFALLTGQAPFHRGEAVATLYAQVNDPVPSLCAIRAELPPEIDRVIARALAKSPADRYAGCGEFAAALRAALTLPRPTTASGRQPWPAQVDAPEIAGSQRELPWQPSSSVSPAFATQSGLTASREGGGYASTVGGGNGSAGSPRSPLASEPGSRPKRLNRRTALIGGTAAVVLAAAVAVLVYAESPAGPSLVAPGSPTRGASAASVVQPASASGSPGSASHPSSPSPGRTSPSPTTTGPGNAVSGQVPGQAPGKVSSPVPGQVTGVTITASDGLVVLKWQGATGKPTGYQVVVSPAPAGQSATQQLGVTTADQIDGLTNGTTYTFTVLASNAQGDGARSAAVTSVPFGPPLTMAAPSAEALAVGATGAGSQSSATATTFAVNVTVGSSTGNGSQITSYTIYAYKAASSGGPWTEVSSAPATARGGGMVVHAGEALFTVSNDGSWYEFTATATNAAGTSAQSPQSSPAIQVAVAPATSSPAT
jgi:serine/threonine-protein kinase